jgi:putative ABC transport system permease protein
MRFLDLVAMKFSMLFGRRAAGQQLDEELRFHLERQIAENRASGMSADEARYAALRSFGNPSLLREQTREKWSWRGPEQFLREIRYGMRTLSRTPGFAIIAVVVMALGIGANVALFTVVRSVILKPLPFQDPGRLMMLYESGTKENSRNVVAGGVFSEWKKQNRSFTDLALYGFRQYGIAGSGRQLPETLTGAQISWNLLSTLGIRPALGRDFTAADDSLSANGTVLLSWSLWKRRFGADPAIVNQTIYLDAKPYTVIGVMPEWFAFPEPDTLVWTPVYHERTAWLMSMLDSHAFRVVGRLRPGASPEQGATDLAMISTRLHDTHPDEPFIMPRATIRPLIDHLVGDLKRPLYVLLAATCCLLLIACINVANLLVARAVARRRELAIRTALGGGRLRLLRERLMESLLLSAAGGALGLLLAYGAVEWLTHTRQDMSRVESIHIDGVVAAFTIGVIAACALFAGLISALTVRDRQLLASLHEVSRSTSGSQARAMLRRILLTAEVGLTVVLLIGAGLLLKSYDRLRAADMGCATQNVLTMRIGLPDARYNTPGPLPVNFFTLLLARVRALPGVDAAGLVNAAPGQGYWEDSSFTIVEHPPLPLGTGVFALNRTAESGYFAAMGIPILRGRTFNDSLRLEQTNEIIVTDLFAKKYFPGEEPLGKHLKTNERTYTIVGIVGDTRFAIGEEPKPMKYFHLNEGRINYGTLVIRSSRDVEQMALPVQRVIQEMDRDLPVSHVLTMNQLLGQSTLDQSFNTTLLTGFAALSLLLAAVGLFGVLSYMAAQRTGEIGIRLALGAPREHVLGKMLSDGLRPAIIGLVLGLAASMEASRLMRDMLYETRPLDPIVFAAVSATLMMVAALACIVPAWRASRVDPVKALRTE